VLDVVDVDDPVPAKGEVVVDVRHCGICGSDLHMVLEGWGQPGSIEGHEWVGVVRSVGEGVDRWRPGDEVVGGAPRPCGRCAACVGGRPSLCAERDEPGVAAVQGAFAQRKVAHAAELLAVPEGLDLRDAALAEPLAVALHGITRAGARAGDRVLVSGCGPIGALTVAALVAMGIDDVVVSEPAPARQAVATKLGADVVDPRTLDVPTIAEPGRVVADAVDVAIECSGKAGAMEAALAQLRRGGTLVLVGAGIEPPRFDPNRILLNELVITGAFTYDADGFERAIDLLARHAIPVDVLVEPGEVTLDELLDAMRRLASGETAGKVLVQPNA
jgi:(R,R)-butanediol dehydrogenase/meso-butanediol dehydrogenase/diacetyl reductase